MTLKEILHITIAFINQEKPTFKMGLDRFNLFIKMANYDYFKLWCGLPEQWQPGQPITTRGFEISEQNKEALKTFINPLTNRVVNGSGQLNYPSGFVHLTQIGYYNSTKARFVPVEIVDHNQLFDRLDSDIIAPNLANPIMVYYNTYMQFYPVNLMNVSMSHLRLPATPIYAVQNSADYDAYDSGSSTQFEWPEQYHNDIVRILLGYISPAAKDFNISAYAENKKKEGI
jgi:hypothetical protein